MGTIKDKNGMDLTEAEDITRPGRGAGTLLPSAQRFVWAARQPLGNAALGALFA